MAKCNLLLVFLGTISCAGLFAQQGSIEGVAINPVTNQPLSGVHIGLSALREGTTVAYGAVSNREGRFSIAAIDPGTYTVRPDRRGFVFTNANRSVTVKPGQRLTGFTVAMNARAVISGRVLDEHGDPMQYIRIMVEPPGTGNPPLPGPFVNTDDRGEFRYSGAPGKYLLRAVPQSRQFQLQDRVQVQEVRTDGSAEPVYSETYYPSTTLADRATLLDVPVGGDITGLEIRMLRQRRLNISGVISGIAPPGMAVRIELQSKNGGYRDGTIQMAGPRSTVPRPDGSFTFVGVSPGNYRLGAIQMAGATRLHSTILEVNLESTDLINMQIALEPAAELTGKVEIAGVPLPPGPRRLVLQRANWSDSGFANGGSAELREDGQFNIPNFLPGYFRVKVEPLPENGYLKSVQVSNVFNTDGFADLPHGGRGALLKVTIGIDAAQISGKVVDHEGDALVNAVAQVFLLTDPTAWGAENMVRVTPDGKYNFKGLRPGKYRLFAAEAAGSNLKEMFAKAEEIDIKPNDRLTKDLKLPGKEVANAR